MLLIKLDGITKCINMVANILPADPPKPLTRSIGQKSTFSEQCHVAYEIKGNHECSNMVAQFMGFICGSFKKKSVLRLLYLCARLFICVLLSPAGKGLTSWLSFVVSNCDFVPFLLVSWVRCGT